MNIDRHTDQNIDSLLNLLDQGKWIYGIHPDMTQVLMAAEDLCHRFNAALPSQLEERTRLLRQLLGSMGERVLIHSPFRCDFGKNIHIGSDVVVNYGLTVLDEARVDIADRVFIGPNVSIYTITHALDPLQRSEGVMRALPVTIESDVWICGNATILPGVVIGRGAVVAAGSVVSRSIPPMHLAKGSPAQAVRPITEADRVDPSLAY